MAVADAFARALGRDLVPADVAEVRAHLGDLRVVRSWLDASEVGAKRRLDDLSRSQGVCPERELVNAGGSTARDAAQVAERSKALDLVPKLEDALNEGTTTAAHVDAFARELRRLEPADRQKLLDEQGDRLTQLASRQTPDEYAKTVKEAAAVAQTDGGLANLAKQKRANQLKWWTDRITGMLHLHGQFDPESALKIVGKLSGLVEELFHDKTSDTCPDDPGLKQDHLKALALIALVEGNTTGSGRPDVIVVVDEQTLRWGISEHSIIDTGQDSFLPVETLRKMACYANIIPVVLSSDGVAVDLGLTVRLANRAQRRAMRAMYPCCAVPGCRVPFEQCVLHHIRYWEHGGNTDLANLLPLCSKHHHLVHEGGWQLHLDPTTRTLTIAYPDGSIQTTGPPRARAG